MCLIIVAWQTRWNTTSGISCITTRGNTGSRRVRVTAKFDSDAQGRKGFDAVIESVWGDREPHQGEEVWGYDHQITKVIPSTEGK
jgi:hypothetical protein